MNEILSRINDFCQVKNNGPAYKNDFNLTPRIQWIINLLKEHGIKYKIDRFTVSNAPLYNLILPGTSSKMVIAHHDIVNPKSDNANDNSASILNAIYLKKICPEINIVFTDAEECGLWGSKRLARQIVDGHKFGKIDWVLNLELTGRGGKNIFVGEHDGDLSKKIKRKFGSPIIRVPLNDCYALEKEGINTTVINPLPLLSEGESEILGKAGFLDDSLLLNIHSEKDSLNTICITEMQEFVEEILLPIVIDPDI